MQLLRSSTLIARLVLAWFALTLGVAVASPIVHPQALELVCSASGSMKLVAVGDEAPGVQASSHSLDCSLCLPAALPAQAAIARSLPPAPAANAQHPFASAHIAALAGAPLPPRGPPLRS